MIENGQHIKCILRNNTAVEGIIEEWGEVVKLRSLHDKSLLIIMHPQDDIMLIKIEPHKNTKNLVSFEEPDDLEKKFEEMYNQSSEDELRVKKLAELRLLQAEQSKKIISDKMKNHHINDLKGVYYGQPRFFKKPNS